MANQQLLDFSDELHGLVLGTLSNTQREAIINELAKAIIDCVNSNEIEREELENE